MTKIINKAAKVNVWMPLAIGGIVAAYFYMFSKSFSDQKKSQSETGQRGNWQVTGLKSKQARS